MRVVCLVLALMLWTGQARAEKKACYPPAALVHGLLLQGFLPTVEVETEKGRPGIIFTNGRGEWVVFSMIGEFMCEAAHGRGWNEVRRRGA